MNGLYACMGYKGNHMKHTRDRLANEMTVSDLKQGRRGGDREEDVDGGSCAGRFLLLYKPERYK